ncbi:2-dehydro-3-deoxyphosphooctonate aldolase [Flavobacterium arcticum]|uniref:2-dehydro-3-deoxyphosphooctonate aldolase n=1 Tax=Flavobacterium arcticum TaxID=1784713 RepID=A0A345HE57_9FLAO|nr:2-dehydro-3-deoxyphosphooctonate aldolase [Flavobacterium arcticum]AXG74867.1 2-dehydro-3-deoxyphosphooctonate aldolase [Flavobacterium arcticum]KAF2509635.1 2-dehydro-3-deoxyphosphooctonate aldolase [Flavobacterium arcticum]
MKKYLLLSCFTLILATSCISTRLTIKNIDDKAPMPKLTKEKTFELTEISSDKKYGYDPDYPINLGFLPVQNADINIKRYFGALSGPQGQPITYELVDSCCPFPSGKNNMGAGLLDVYEVTWEGLSVPKRLHINLYERGEIIAPAGFGIKKIL